MKKTFIIVYLICGVVWSAITFFAKENRPASGTIVESISGNIPAILMRISGWPVYVALKIYNIYKGFSIGTAETSTKEA